MTWSDDENVRWKLELPGPGSSCAVVAGDRVFVTCYEVVESDDEQALVKRYLVYADAAAGEIAWTKEIPAAAKDDPFSGFLESEHGYASNTPVVADGRVIAFYGKGGAAAYSLEGEELWDFRRRQGDERVRLGFGRQPGRMERPRAHSGFGGE